MAKYQIYRDWIADGWVSFLRWKDDDFVDRVVEKLNAQAQRIQELEAELARLKPDWHAEGYVSFEEMILDGSDTTTADDADYCMTCQHNFDDPCDNYPVCTETGNPYVQPLDTVAPDVFFYTSGLIDIVEELTDKPIVDPKSASLFNLVKGIEQEVRKEVDDDVQPLDTPEGEARYVVVECTEHLAYNGKIWQVIDTITKRVQHAWNETREQAQSEADRLNASTPEGEAEPRYVVQRLTGDDYYIYDRRTAMFVAALQHNGLTEISLHADKFSKESARKHANRLNASHAGVEDSE